MLLLKNTNARVFVKASRHRRAAGAAFRTAKGLLDRC